MSIKYRKLTASGDYTFGYNDQDFLTGTEAVAQAIKTSLLLLKGEWWEDTESGLPLFQEILGKPGTPENIRAIDLLVKEAISNVQDVIDIINFSSDYSNRTYSISCAVDTKYGQVELEVSF